MKTRLAVDNRMPLICFLGDASSVHLQRWVVSSLERGFRAHIVTRREWKDCPVQQTVINPGGRSLGWFTALPRLIKAVASIRPDIIHAHYATSYGFWAALLGKRPMIITAWGTDILVTPKQNFVARILTGWTLRKADLITADSEEMLSEIRKYRPRAQLEVIQWGVDVGRFEPSRAGAANDNGPHIVSIRMWEPNYNIDIILKGFRQFCDRWHGAKPILHLIGGGTLENSLRALVQELNLAENVLIHGYLRENEIIDILGKSDISVSIPTSDATAMSVLESMAAQLPIIASDLPDNRYWIGEGGGVIIERLKPDAVAEALLKLAAAPGLCRQIGERNRQKVSAEADRKMHMDRMAALYHSLLDDHPAW